MFEPVDQIARSLHVEADDRSVAAQVLELVVETVAERKARNELRFVALDKVLVGGPLQEITVQIAHVDHIDVDGPQRERRIARIGPQIGPSRTRQRSPVVGAVLEVDGELDLGFGLVDRTVAPRAPRH